MGWLSAPIGAAITHGDSDGRGGKLAVYRVIYTSRAASPLSGADLKAIFNDARSSNSEHGVTGVLMYAESSFVQILEGEQFVVRRLVEKIQADSRQCDMEILLQEAIEERAFSTWEMAYQPHGTQTIEIAGTPGVTTVAELSERLSINCDYVSHFLKSSAERLFEPA